MFPNLKSLDFAKVTDDEKDAAKLHIIVNNTNVKKYSLWIHDIVVVWDRILVGTANLKISLIRHKKWK